MNNIKIMGDGTIGEGEYKKISIFGEGEILGAIKAERLKVFGEANAKKDISLNKLNIFGQFLSKESVHIKEALKVSGDATFHDKVQGNLIKISGESRFNKGVESNFMKVLGSCNVNGNCEGENIIINGEINVDGLLSGDRVYINLFSFCKVKEIGGENIRVRKRGLKSLFLGGRAGRLYSDLIEGDNIVLTNTECDVVRGKKVIINSGCNIGKIEYEESLEVNSKSKVGERIWRKN